jgi:hypothetical protein
MSHYRAARAVAACSLIGFAYTASAVELGDPSFSLHGAQLSAERSWGDVLTSGGSELVNQRFVAGAVAAPYAEKLDGALRFEAEAQLVYNFGAQDHWEVRAIPFVARWQRFPWNHWLATSAAWGVGFSYANELPLMEATLREESRQLLVHWFAEMSIGPRTGPWSLALRLHHRSDGLGLLGTEGGMNALGMGLTFRF